MSTEDQKRKSLAEAKAHFADCIRRVERGESIILTRHGRPVARLEALERFSGKDGLETAEEVREASVEYDPTPSRLLFSAETRQAALRRLLEEEIWPHIPEEMTGKGPTKAEREEILGMGEKGR